MGKNTLKAREREVGPAVEKIAKRSCEDAEREFWRKDASEVTVAIGTSWAAGKSVERDTVVFVTTLNILV